MARRRVLHARRALDRAAVVARRTQARVRQADVPAAVRVLVVRAVRAGVLAAVIVDLVAAVRAADIASSVCITKGASAPAPR